MTPCPRCNTNLSPGALECPHCGLFTHLDELQHLGNEAQRAESANPLLAANIWERALDLLPPNTPQYHQLYDRIRWLRNQPPAPDALFVGDNEGAILPNSTTPPRDDNWRVALFKTGGSLLLNIPFYAFLFHRLMPYQTDAWITATYMGVGFLLLILIHEMGHVLAMRHYRLSASPPIFIPFVGALINLRQPPRNAKVEAIVGIGGPALGTIGAIACYGLYLWTKSDILLLLSFWGFAINLFNMLPLPPLDGGRITAAVSPWIWLVGLGMLVVMIIASNFQSFLLILILFFALPRVMATLKGRDRHNPYYRISRRSSWIIGLSYVGLTLLLMAFMFIINIETHLIDG